MPSPGPPRPSSAIGKPRAPRALLAEMNRLRVLHQLSSAALGRNEDARDAGVAAIGDEELGRVNVVPKPASAKLEGATVDDASEASARGERVPSKTA